MNNHPEQGDGGTNQAVTLLNMKVNAKSKKFNLEEKLNDDDLVPRGPHIEHDVANEVVVQGKSCLVIMIKISIVITNDYDHHLP